MKAPTVETQTFLFLFCFLLRTLAMGWVYLLLVCLFFPVYWSFIVSWGNLFAVLKAIEKFSLLFSPCFL